MPREDSKIKRQQGAKFGLKSISTKKKPEEPIHNVSSAELDSIVQYLKDTGVRLAASVLSETVLSRPLDKTNLSRKLSRDPRLRRDNELFYYEIPREKTEVPLKVVEAIENSYYKVKAKLLGSPKVHSVDNLLERIYKISLTHAEYELYRQVLLEKLNADEGMVRTSKAGSKPKRIFGCSGKNRWN